MDTNDQWGYVSVPKVGMQLLISGAGVRYIEPDENGIRHALNGAKELVRHTTPLTQEGEGKHV